MDEGYAAWAARWRVPLGFALAVAYLVFCQPTRPLLVAGGGVALLGLVVRGWARAWPPAARTVTRAIPSTWGVL